MPHTLFNTILSDSGYCTLISPVCMAHPLCAGGRFVVGYYMKRRRESGRWWKQGLKVLVLTKKQKMLSCVEPRVSPVFCFSPVVDCAFFYMRNSQVGAESLADTLNILNFYPSNTVCFFVLMDTNHCHQSTNHWLSHEVRETWCRT